MALPVTAKAAECEISSRKAVVVEAASATASHTIVAGEDSASSALQAAAARDTGQGLGQPYPGSDAHPATLQEFGSAGAVSGRATQENHAADLSIETDMNLSEDGAGNTSSIVAHCAGQDLTQASDPDIVAYPGDTEEIVGVDIDSDW